MMNEVFKKTANAKIRGAKGRGEGIAVTPIMDKLMGGTWVGGEVVLTEDFDDRVQSVAFAHDDKHLLASTPWGPVVIYTLDRDELIESARARLVRGFTKTECDRYFPDSTCPTLEELRLG